MIGKSKKCGLAHGRRAAALLLAALAILLSGCAPPVGTVCLSYQNTAARAEVKVRRGGAEYGAVVELCAPQGEAARDMRIKFTSPEALKGISVERSMGALILRYGDLVLPGDAFADMTVAADAFMLTSPVSLAGVIKADDGTPRTLVTLADGSEVVIDPQSGFPLSIKLEDAELEILVFEPQRQ